MKRLKKLLTCTLIALTCLAFAGCGKQTDKNSEDVANANDFNIVTSFYPMHILVMNLTKDIDGVSETCMSEPNMGCIHDHTFTTDDLKKIENADVFVENGLDLETFNDKIEQAYPDTAIIDASTEVANPLQEGEEVNGHVFANIEDYVLQVQYVSSQLQALDPDHKDDYEKNTDSYVDELTKLMDEYNEQLATIAGTKVCVLDETLPYVCDYAQLDVLEIETDHEQEALSADNLKNVISEMNNDGVKAIFIAKGSDRKNAEAIAQETGATIYELNTCMVGEDISDAYYIDMKENFDIIANME